MAGPHPHGVTTSPFLGGVAGGTALVLATAVYT